MILVALPIHVRHEVSIDVLFTVFAHLQAAKCVSNGKKQHELTAAVQGSVCFLRSRQFVHHLLVVKHHECTVIGPVLLADLHKKLH